MSQQALQALIDAVRNDAALQQKLSSTAAADVDAVALWAREAGFDVVSRDFVDHAEGALVEYEDEDYFLKSGWWTLD
jgi:predicted ribosomally synthesized peptide with nif11-like leader